MFALFAQAVASATGTAAAAMPTASPSATADAAVDAVVQAAPWYAEMLDSGAMHYILAGGFFMWPLLFLGVLAFGVIIERYRSLKMLSTDTEKLRRDVLDLLQARKAEASFHDPYVDTVPPTREHAAFTGMKSVALTPEYVAAQDAVIIVTDHDNVDYGMVAKHAKLVVDTRNALVSVTSRDNIVKA